MDQCSTAAPSPWTPCPVLLICTVRSKMGGLSYHFTSLDDLLADGLWDGNHPQSIMTC